MEKKLRKSTLIRLNKKKTKNSTKAMTELRDTYTQWYQNGEGKRKKN